MNALRRSVWCAAIMSAACVPAVQSAEPKLPRDGWVSWDVAAIDNAPAWCCFGWSDHDAAPASCKLDGHSNNGFGTRGHETTDSITVYARSAAGKVDRLMALSSSCPVEAKSPIQQLADVTSDDSARWLDVQVQTRSLAENALAALSVHRGDFPRDALIRLGTADAAADIRSKSWFWLAMMGAPGAEKPISAAIKQDPDDGVREQAVFALSRLPDERATEALIVIAEDRSLAREQRKRAVFWLSQSESTAALAFLDRILAAPGTQK